MSVSSQTAPPVFIGVHDASRSTNRTDDVMREVKINDPMAVD